MYLLILLMTYVSAIYEYNLSVRPDYDRDIARKKASAIFYKFDIQHSKALQSINYVRSRLRDDGVTPVDKTFPQPDMLFAGSNARCEVDTICKNKNYHKSTLFFEHNGYDIPIYLRPECVASGSVCAEDNREDCDQENGSWYQKVMLSTEQSLYDETEMVSKLLCLQGKLYESPEKCESTKDEAGNLQDSCCNAEGTYRFLVSYKKVDPRWLNRVNNGIAMDFWRAIESRPFYTNLGIVQWDEDEDKWIFKGKTSIFAAYHEKYDAWKAQEQQKMEEDSTYVEKIMPKYMKNVTKWELPSDVFTEDFFEGVDGSTDFCKENGCIFRLNEF